MISSGQVGYEHLEVQSGSTIRILGPADRRRGEPSSRERRRDRVRTSGGAIELFVTESAAFAPEASVINTTSDPTVLSIRVAAEQDENAAEPALALDQQGSFHGFVYAPKAKARLGGELEFFGGAVASSLELAPTARLHFDLALEAASNRTGTAPLAMAWRLIGDRQAIGPGRLDPFRALGVDRATLGPPAHSHDLAGVGIKTRYIDLLGTQRIYRGPESGFDWSQVRSVLDSVRSSPVTYAAGVAVVSNGTLLVSD